MTDDLRDLDTLMRTDPLNLTDPDIDAIITRFREGRHAFNATLPLVGKARAGKAAKTVTTKTAVDDVEVNL